MLQYVKDFKCLSYHSDAILMIDVHYNSSDAKTSKVNWTGIEVSMLVSILYGFCVHTFYKG